MHAEAIRADALATPEELLEAWTELAGDPDAPRWCEITEYAEVVVTPPPAPRHQTAIMRIAAQIERQLGGLAIAAPPVLTPTAGIRCPDVLWLPPGREAEGDADTPLRAAPPLVVEVLSPGNRRPEIARKIEAYLQWGVTEVVVAALDGTVRYHRADGAHTQSTFGLQLSPAP